MDSFEEWLTEPGKIAARLRTLRVQAGLSGKELADAAGWAPSKVSRIENGHQMASPEDVLAWARTCGADQATVEGLLRKREEARIAHADFRDRMHHGQAHVQESYNALVARSTLIRHFETVFVPGLLQVPGYAKRVFAEMVTLHGLEVDDVDTAVATRLQRQRFLYDPGKRFEFLLCEPVLRWMLVPPAVMRTQIDRLQTVIGLAHVRFGILPMGQILRTTPQNSFQIYAGEDTVAVVETFIGETTCRGDEAGKYGRALDLMWEEAAEGEQARELLIQAAGQWGGN